MRYYLSILVLITLIIFSCKKEEPIDEDSNTNNNTTNNNDSTNNEDTTSIPSITIVDCIDSYYWNNSIIYGTVMDVDGINYNTVIIGNQEWMAENLQTTHYNNGDEILIANSDSLWLDANNQELAACSWISVIEDSVETDFSSCIGVNYNGYVLADSRNVCPIGWHVPSYDDILDLETYIIDTLGYGINSAYPLKTTEGWVTYNGSDGNGGDVYGFRGKPGRLRSAVGSYTDELEDYLAYWWTSTDSITNGYLNYHFWGLGANNTNIIGPNPYAAATNGYQIRCIRD